MPSRLLIITNLYPLPWDPNRATFNLQQFKRLSGIYELYVLVPIAWPDWARNRKKILQHNNVKYIPYFYTPKLLRYFYGAFMFSSIAMFGNKWIDSIGPDYVLASWAFPEGVAAALHAKLKKTPFFLKVHGSDINMHGKELLRAKQIVWAANRAQGVLSVSQALRNKLISMGVQEHKIKVIYNGVDSDMFIPNHRLPIGRRSSLLFVGNLKKEKGVIELLSAFSQISEKHPKLSLCVVGEGVMKKTMMDNIETLHLQNKVQVLGGIDHHALPALMQNARMLLLPSYNEGVPNVVLEAMASGVPVIATSVGGIPEVVDEGVTGFMIDKPDAHILAQAIEKALSHSWDSHAIRNVSIAYSWDENIQRLQHLIGA